VILPNAFLPAVLLFLANKDFSALTPLVRASLVRTAICLSEGDVGLNFLIPIIASLRYL